MTNHSSDDHHILPVSTYVKTYLALLVFMVLTVGVALLPHKFPALQEMSLLNNLVAMGIATIKALLVVMIFMGVRFGTALTRIFASLGFVWLFLMTLILVDYRFREPESTKGWEKVPGNALSRVKNQPGT